MATTAAGTLLAPADPATGAAERGAERHPYRRPAVVVVAGYAALALVMLGIGMLLTHALAGSVGRWDEHVNAFLAKHRDSAWNDITKYTTDAFDTVPAVAMSAVIVAFLAVRRRLREAVFIVLALFLEISVFLSVTFVVGRPRPGVVRLNSTPSTSSFPSGHTAAATVIFVGLTVIVCCCTARAVARIAVGALATVVVAAVGFARVYRGLHHPTDVIVGALFGLGCLTVAAMAVRAHDPRPRVRSEVAPQRCEREAGQPFRQ